MDSKVISDLALLEQNILENFCYYYQCNLVAEFGNPLYAAIKEKIMLRMKENDFRLSEQALSLIEASGDIKSIPFKFVILKIEINILIIKTIVTKLEIIKTKFIPSNSEV